MQPTALFRPAHQRVLQPTGRATVTHRYHLLQEELQRDTCGPTPPGHTAALRGAGIRMECSRHCAAPSSAPSHLGAQQQGHPQLLRVPSCALAFWKKSVVLSAPHNKPFSCTEEGNSAAAQLPSVQLCAELPQDGQGAELQMSGAQTPRRSQQSKVMESFLPLTRFAAGQKHAAHVRTWTTDREQQR